MLKLRLLLPNSLSSCNAPTAPAACGTTSCPCTAVSLLWFRFYRLLDYFVRKRAADAMHYTGRPRITVEFMKCWWNAVTDAADASYHQMFKHAELLILSLGYAPP